MTQQSSPLKLAVIVWGISMLLIGGLIVLSLFGVGNLGSDRWLERAFTVLLFTSFVTIGSLILMRRPGHPIGWIFTGVTIMFLIEYYADDYALYSLTLHPGALPGGEWAAWVESWVGIVVFASMLTFTFLLFPNGHFLSPRWRAVAWFTAVLIGIQVTAQMLVPGPMVSFPGIENPFGMAQSSSVLRWLVDVLPVFGGGCIILSALSLLLRYLRARGSERMQIQWIAFGAAIPIIVLLLVSLLMPKVDNKENIITRLYNLLLFLSVLAFPLTTGVAILRYRLYEIEFLIRRTLIYGLLTACLSGIYFGCVVLLQQVFRIVLKTEGPGVIVISTLVIAALFSPLRLRIQKVIDKRFYRRRYDANQILQAFSTKLRNEMDPARLHQYLLEVVEDTIQPEGVSLWIRNKPPQE